MHESPRSLWMISGCPDIRPWGCVFVQGSSNVFLQRLGGIFQTLHDHNLHGTVHFHLVLGDHGLLLTKFIQNHEHNEILLIRWLNTLHIFLITSNTDTHTHTHTHLLTHSLTYLHNNAHRYESDGCWSWLPIAFSQVDQVYFCSPECNRNWTWVPEIWGDCLQCQVEGQQSINTVDCFIMSQVLGVSSAVILWLNVGKNTHTKPPLFFLFLLSFSMRRFF